MASLKDQIAALEKAAELINCLDANSRKIGINYLDGKSLSMYRIIKQLEEIISIQDLALMKIANPLCIVLENGRTGVIKQDDAEIAVEAIKKTKQLMEGTNE